MHHVFISYARRDKPLIAPVVDALRAHDIGVWIDEASIPYAVPWQDEIDAAVHSAELVACFVTPNWLSSGPCQSEFAEATRAGKLIVTLDPVTASTADIVATITAALDRVPEEYRHSTNVLGRVRSWQDSGRRRYFLGSRSLIRGAKEALIATGAWDIANVQAFVSLSKRRNLWRRIGAVFVLITAPISLLGLQVVAEFNDQLDAQASDRLRSMSRETAIAQAHSSEPTAALDAIVTDAASNGVDFDVTGYRLLHLAQTPFPYRSSEATPPEALLADTSVVGSRADVLPDGEVTIRDAEGALTRVVPPTTGTVGVAWSPDGRLLAIARPGDIHIVNVATGRTAFTLSGAVTGAASSAWDYVTGVDWDDAGIVHASIRGSGIVSWDLSAFVPTAIAGEPWIVTGAPLGDHIAVATRDGRVLAVESSGAIIRERTPDGDRITTQLHATDDPQHIAALDLTPLGETQLTILNSQLAPTAAFPLPEQCIPGGVATTPTRYVVACGNGLFTVVDRASGHVTEKMTTVSAVSITAADERLYARDQSGLLAILAEDLSSATFVASMPCFVSSSLMTYLPAGNQVLVAGPGTAGTCLSHSYDLTNNTPNTLAFPWVSSPRSQALAASLDGRSAAYGFDDGTVWVVASDGDTAYPRQVNLALGAAVRALAFSPDGRVLTAVSVDGRVTSITVSEDPLADALRVAESSIAHARELGWGA